MADEPKSKSQRRPLRFWGWGYADEDLSAEENAFVEAAVARLVPGGAVELDPPQIDDFDLPASRLNLPENLTDIVSTSPYDRLVHAFGKSFADMARMYLRDVPNAPDGVAFPRCEGDLVAIYEYAREANVAVIPFGGGTSVCGGVEADVTEAYSATITVDMQQFDKVLRVDKTSRRARIQGGAFGPDIEAQLKPHGLTLRHFPQSFVFSTLGGWIATRAGGHFATLYTHIDDLVEATRMVSPSGVIETRELPGSGAGPSADRMILGSEGTLGIITEATMRLQDRPTFRATTSFAFDTMQAATHATRLISQAGLFPSNCRVLDPAEVTLNQVLPEEKALLIVAFESADHDVTAWMERACEIAIQNGGSILKESDMGDGAAAWRQAFIRMPYWRNRLTAFGIIADTFETAITWDKWDGFYTEVKSRMTKAIKDITGQDCLFSCRITHVYPDGPAPYFTFYAVGDTKGDMQKSLDHWRKIKAAANDVVVALGGTITHHHAVGRDHRSGYEAQTSPLFRHTLSAAKAHLDPAGVLNPGVLIDPQGRKVGITGAMTGMATTKEGEV